MGSVVEVVMLTPGLTTMERFAVPLMPATVSVTFTLKLSVPAVSVLVSVPVIAPAEESDSPPGSVVPPVNCHE